MPDTSNSESTPGAVTILIPHYQTPESIKLCLRCLRKYTTHPIVVRVLDNGSTDESLAYLSSLPWIELIQTGIPNDTWTAHHQSLNEAVANVRTEHFLVMHSDTYVHHDGWLQFLLGELARTGSVVTGSHDQAISVSGLWRWFRWYHNRHIREYAPGVPIIRSLCALYKTKPFVESRCRFYTQDREDITYAANAQLVAAGHKIRPLPASTLCKYMFHSSATTRIANRTYDRSPEAHLRKHDRYRRLPWIQAVLADESLDH